MNEIRTERIYESAESDGAYRILVDRLWARGLSKEKAALDEWWKELAPSAELRKWFGHEADKYEEFKARYFAELAQSAYAADCRNRIDRLLKEKDVVLLYAAKDREHNNALALKEWLEKVC